MNFIKRVYGRFLPAVKGLVAAFLLALSLISNASASEAGDVIEAFHADLLTTMQNAKAWGFEARREFLADPVRDAFDSEIMVRLAAGPNWKTFSETEKADLAEAFYQFSLATYASRFKGYSGQEFVTIEEIPMRKGRILVSTKLVKNENEEVMIGYVMYPEPGGGYQVIDVYLDGKFSELSQRRSEFSPIIRDRGFTGLLSLLKEKVSDLEADALDAS